MKDSTFYFKGLLAVGPYKGYVVLFCRLFTRFAMIRVAMLGLMVVAPLLIVAGVSADARIVFYLRDDAGAPVDTAKVNVPRRSSTG